MRARPRFCRVTSFVAAGAACSVLCAASARAQVPAIGAAAPESDESGESGARKHFQRALELYRAGQYAEALPEIERAAALDPKGKDLFFNLALVHEKLGQFPAAIAALERFRELEPDPNERERARLSIERLRGAELHAGQPPAAPPCPKLGDSASAAAGAGQPARTAILVGAASLAAVSAAFGAVFGLKALADDVQHRRTGSALPVASFHERARRAELEALAADVAFGVALASSATFIGVWLLTPGEPKNSGAIVTLRGYF